MNNQEKLSDDEIEAEHDPDCSACARAQEDYAALEREADDLVALVQRLARELRRAAPDNDLPEKALDYLRRKNLQGTPLRGADAAQLKPSKNRK